MNNFKQYDDNVIKEISGSENIEKIHLEIFCVLNGTVV